MEDLSRQEELLKELILRNDREAAVGLLFNLIVGYAKQKNFHKAEALREKLYELDSLALNEIIKSGELIEAEKSQSIDPDHLFIWSKLHDTLSTEERNALYYALKHQSYQVNEYIFKQGGQNTKLYFIDQGSVALTFRNDHGRESILRKLEAGDIAGVDTFFSDTVCTTSLITLSLTRVSCLEKEVLLQWQKDYPILETKLQQYCLGSQDILGLIKERGIERRSHQRLSLSGTAVIQLLSTTGALLGKAFKGELSNVSPGGLSVYFPGITNRRAARALLGRELTVAFPLPLGDSQVTITRTGAVVAVQHRSFEGFSMHLRFNEALGEREWKGFLRSREP